MAEARIVQDIVGATRWDQRVALIRTIPAKYGTNQQRSIYADIARKLYVPKLDEQFAYMPWRDEYELTAVQTAYASVMTSTGGFTRVAEPDIAQAINDDSRAVLIFRLILGFLPNEFCESTKLPAGESASKPISRSRLNSLERGTAARDTEATICARTITRAMERRLYPDPPHGWRHKIDKPDTANGWDTIRQLAVEGVPLSTFLHQRHYGGSFRQLQDSTSSIRGDEREDLVEGLFQQHGISYIRTGSTNQAQIEQRFGLAIRPAPDFVVFQREALNAILECKLSSDGGTSRDKANRFETLRNEAMKLGGVPVFAVLSGLGWGRVSDTLGPIIRDTEGRAFTKADLPDILTVQPFTELVRA